MSARRTWGAAASVAAALEGADRRALDVLLCMPLLPYPALAALLGVHAGAVWVRLGRLAARDLVAAVAVPGVRKRPVWLWHLTDLGLAALAYRLGREPAALARAAGHDRPRLAALLASLPAHLALCDAARLLAAAGPGQPRLLGWWRPWRATFTPASRATPVRLGLPARLALAWGDAAGPRRDDPVGDYLLLPDCGAVPPAYWAPALAALARWVAAGAATPTGLLIALTNPLADAARRPARSAAGRTLRESAWARLCAAVWPDNAPCPVATVPVLTAGEEAPRDEPLLPAPGPRAAPPVRALDAATLRPRRPGRSLPHPVGPAPDPTPALGVGAWALLDLIGRHPFLPRARVGAALGVTPQAARGRATELLDRGLLRLVTAAELEAAALTTAGPRATTTRRGRAAALAARGLLEVTAAGAAALAAGWGVSLPAAIAWAGLVGGGPERPVGGRARLLRDIEHTLGADAFFLALADVAVAAQARGGADTLLTWNGPAAMTRCGRVRPDGYGVYARGGRAYHLWLEYDRGHEGRRTWVRKLAGYRALRDSGRWRALVPVWPRLLVVTTGTAAEARILAAARAAGAHGDDYPLRTTTEGRLAAAPGGPVAAIWRAPECPDAPGVSWVMSSEP